MKAMLHHFSSLFALVQLNAKNLLDRIAVVIFFSFDKTQVDPEGVTTCPS